MAVGAPKRGVDAAKVPFHLKSPLFQQGAVGVGGKGFLIANLRMVPDLIAEFTQRGLDLTGKKKAFSLSCKEINLRFKDLFIDFISYSMGEL